MIYTATLIRIETKPNRLPWDTRCVGFYYELNRAIESVENADHEYMDLSEEGYYKYCVIEPRCEGSYSMNSPHTQYWYRWNKEKQLYVKCKKPKRFKHTIAFSIG